MNVPCLILCQKPINELSDIRAHVGFCRFKKDYISERPCIELLHTKFFNRFHLLPLKYCNGLLSQYSELMERVRTFGMRPNHLMPQTEMSRLNRKEIISFPDKSADSFDISCSSQHWKALCNRESTYQCWSPSSWNPPSLTLGDNGTARHLENEPRNHSGVRGRSVTISNLTRAGLRVLRYRDVPYMFRFYPGPRDF